MVLSWKSCWTTITCPQLQSKSATIEMWTSILCIIFGPILPLIQYYFNQHEQSLPRLNIDQIAISGFSSGGFFAQQMYLAHSELFSGMASLSGGPFLCAEATNHTRKKANQWQKPTISDQCAMQESPKKLIALHWKMHFKCILIIEWDLRGNKNAKMFLCFFLLTCRGACLFSFACNVTWQKSSSNREATEKMYYHYFFGNYIVLIRFFNSAKS